MKTKTNPNRYLKAVVSLIGPALSLFLSYATSGGHVPGWAYPVAGAIASVLVLAVPNAQNTSELAAVLKGVLNEMGAQAGLSVQYTGTGGPVTATSASGGLVKPSP